MSSVLLPFLTSVQHFIHHLSSAFRSPSQFRISFTIPPVHHLDSVGTQAVPSITIRSASSILPKIYLDQSSTICGVLARVQHTIHSISTFDLAARVDAVDLNG